MDIRIEEALPHQADELSDIAFQAKSYWGYSSQQLDLWREFLTISPEYIQNNRVWVAVNESRKIVGFGAIEQGDEGAILEHLWVLPDCIGHGIGKRLFQYVASMIAEFVFTSDPHADDFYLKMGATKNGEYESLLQRRMLTKFRYTSK